MRSLALVLVAMIALPSLAPAADSPATQPASAAAEYDAVVRERAAKIVAAMTIDDPAKAERVTSLIAEQYKALSRIHDAQDASKEADAKEQAQRELEAVHKQFIASLEAELTPQQVEQVKDGMTYNVVNITYAGFLDMLPELTEPQKDTILSMLKEAREHAMMAGTSREKHAWFGKYKGRINNYLSKEGYDLKKASKEWNERIRARQQQSEARPQS